MAAKKDDAGWFPIDVMAEMFGLTKQGFHTSIRAILPASAVRGAGEKGVRINARAAIDAWVNHKLEQQRAALAGGSADDALVYSGGDSPNLERLRAAKADREEMARDRDRGTHADLRDLHNVLMRFAGHVRQGGEILQRQFGPVAADSLNEAIAEAERDCLEAIRGAVGPDQPPQQPVAAERDPAGGGGGAGEKAADDAPVRRAGNRPAKRPVPRAKAKG